MPVVKGLGAPWTAAGSGMRHINVESQETMALVLRYTKKYALDPSNAHTDTIRSLKKRKISKPLASFALVPTKRLFPHIESHSGQQKIETLSCTLSMIRRNRHHGVHAGTSQVLQGWAARYSRDRRIVVFPRSHGTSTLRKRR